MIFVLSTAFLIWGCFAFSCVASLTTAWTRFFSAIVFAAEPFAAKLVDAEVIWAVVQRTRLAHDLEPETEWSMTMADTEGSGEPRMQFRIGSQSLTTDAAGRELPAS